MVVNLIKKIKGLNHAKNLLKFGADIVDVGGESTKPGSKASKLKRRMEVE